MRAIIRKAILKDSSRIVDLGKKAVDESPVYNQFGVSERKIKQILVSMISAKRHYVGVIDKDDTVQGFLMGSVDEMPFCTKKQASDWAFHVEPDFKGYTPYLIRDFLTWGWEQKGVVMVGLSNSAGSNIEKTEALFTKMGLSRIGGIWLDGYKTE